MTLIQFSTPPTSPIFPGTRGWPGPRSCRSSSLEVLCSCQEVASTGASRQATVGAGGCAHLVPGTGCAPAPASAPICRAESFGPNCPSSCFCAALSCPSCPLPTRLPLPPHSKLSCQWKSRISFSSFPGLVLKS